MSNVGADLVFGGKKLTLPGIEPGTDGFQAHHRNHCSISICMNAGRFPKVLYFPITNLTVGVLFKTRPKNRLLLLENIIVNQKYQHDRIPRLTCSKNEGADQLRSHCVADLCLCFRICKILLFTFFFLFFFHYAAYLYRVPQPTQLVS